MPDRIKRLSGNRDPAPNPFEGRPQCKACTTEDGSGLVLGGDAGYVQIFLRSKNPSVKLYNKDGREQLIEVE